MPWLLVSPGHQHPWYWLCRIGKFLSYLRKDFSSVMSMWRNDIKCKYMYMFLFPLKNLACEWLKHGMHFPKGLWAHNWSLMKILFALILILTVQSGHNFAQGMAAELAWHAQNWDWSHHHHYYCHYIKRQSNASFNSNSKLVLLWLEIYIFFYFKIWILSSWTL